MDGPVTPERSTPPAPGAAARVQGRAEAAIDAAVDPGAEPPQRALARGLRVLQCFTVAEPELGARELAARTGLPKPTLLRIVATLRQLGMLRHLERRNVYALAPGCLALAAPALSAIGLRQLARPAMQALADHAQGQVALAAGDVDGFVYVETAQGAGTLLPRPEIGAPASLSRSASGRALLTLVPDDRARAAIERITAGDPARRQWLDDKLAETRHDLATLGYCLNRGELNRDLVGVAVPMPVAATDGLLYVFACSVPVFRLNEQPALLLDLGPRLIALVESLRGATGGLRT